MVNEHVAVKLPWMTKKLNIVSQPILLEYEMVHDLNQAVFRI